MINLAKTLFDQPLLIRSAQGDCVWISGLDEGAARKHSTVLSQIHNLIPFVHWSEEDIVRTEAGVRKFFHKWELSILLTDGTGKPVGFLISYLRPPDQNFADTSVYMHRMAIVQELQRRSIGAQVISIYLKRVFADVPVQYVTLQANDNVQNAPIIRLYESLGFKKLKHVFYPDKTDWLMVCSRAESVTVAK